MISLLVNPTFLDAILRLFFVRKEEKSNASAADVDSGFFSQGEADSKKF